MSRNVTVTFSDGSRHVYQGVPLDVAPEVVQQKAETEFGKSVKALDGGVKSGQGLGESVGRRLAAGFGRAAGGLAQGASYMAGAFLPPDAEGSASGVTDPRDLNVMSRGLKSLGNRAEDYWKGVGDASEVGGIPGAALEGAGGALTSGVPGLASVLSGAGAGAGQEGARRLFGDNALGQIGGAVLGGMAGGGAAGLVNRARPQTADIAREMLEGLDPAMLRKAQAFQQAARKGGGPGGVDMDLAQALEAVGAPASNVATVRNFLANRSQGNQVQGMLRAQPGQLSIAADLFAGGLPGTNYGMTRASGRVVEAATELIEQAKKARSAEVRELYAAAGNLPPEAHGRLVAVAQGLMNRPGTLPEVKADLATFIKRISGGDLQDMAERQVTQARKAMSEAQSPSQRLAAQQQLAQAKGASAGPTDPLHALDVDAPLSALTGPYKPTPLNPGNPRARGQISYAGSTLNRELRDMSPAIEAAEQRFAALSGPVNRLKEGPVGVMTGRQGAQAGMPTPTGRFEALLARGTDPSAKVSDIRTLGQQLAKVDPEAVPNAVKSYVSMRIKQAMDAGADSATSANNADMAKRIHDGLFGNQMQYQGLKDAVVVSAESMGKNPREVARGMDHLVRLTKALQSRPQSIGGMQGQEIFSMGGKSYGADALRIFGFLPFERAARRIEDRVLNKTLSELDVILTSPQGADMLIELGKTPLVSKKAMMVLGTFGGATGSMDGPGQE